VTLLGDAAHPMVPRGSNGAGQAILDARALADCLAAIPDPVEALKAYEAERLPATARIVLTNRANPPDAILREVYLRTGDKPFARIEDVISTEELVAITDSYKTVAGLKEMSAWRKWCLTPIILCLALAAGAQEPYPKRPVKMMVPFTPGTGMDILARTLAAKLAERWNNPVVVENRPGASGNIGTDAVAKSPPDGYTLLVTANTIVLNRGLFKAIPYDPVRDFEPVLPLALGKMALVVHPSVPATNVSELVALARANPGRHRYASPGRGTPHHLAMELFKQSTGIDLVHVPYKGSGPGGDRPHRRPGQGDVPPLHLAQPQVQAEKLRILEGLSGIDVDIWYALYAPAGTPREIIARLSTDINAVLKEPLVRDALAKQGWRRPEEPRRTSRASPPPTSTAGPR
jgi:tripartite-type tricarboxylate transporter receptor subunit TctC